MVGVELGRSPVLSPAPPLREPDVCMDAASGSRQTLKAHVDMLMTVWLVGFA